MLRYVYKRNSWKNAKFCKCNCSDDSVELWSSVHFKDWG